MCATYNLAVEIRHHSDKHVAFSTNHYSFSRYFLKFSEIIEPSLEDVVATMLLNVERTLAAGVPTPLTLPPVSAAEAARRVPVPAADERRKYEVPDDDEDDQYDDLPHSHQQRAQTPPPPRPPRPPSPPQHLTSDGGYHQRGASGSDDDFQEYAVAKDSGYPSLPLTSIEPVCTANSLYGSIGDEENAYDELGGEDIPNLPPPRPARGNAAEASMYGPPDGDTGLQRLPPRPPKDAHPHPPDLVYGYEHPDDDDRMGAPPPPRPAKPNSSAGHSVRPPSHVSGEELVYGDVDHDPAPPPPRPPKR